MKSNKELAELILQDPRIEHYNPDAAIAIERFAKSSFPIYAQDPMEGAMFHSISKLFYLRRAIEDEVLKSSKVELFSLYDAEMNGLLLLSLVME